MISVKSRAHRILKPLPRYLDVAADPKLLDSLQPPMLSASETALGIYKDESQDVVLFTSHALYVLRDQSWKRLLYADIERITPPSSKTAVQGFTVWRRDGSEFWLPVSGSSDGRLFDCFEMIRFLDRVRSDLNGAG